MFTRLVFTKDSLPDPTDKEGKAKVEVFATSAYRASDQCLKLMDENSLTPSFDNPYKIRTEKPVLASVFDEVRGESLGLTKEIDAIMLTGIVPIRNFDTEGWLAGRKGKGFPVANRRTSEGATRGGPDLKTHFSQPCEQGDFLDTLSDFHLLLWLSKKYVYRIGDYRSAKLSLL